MSNRETVNAVRVVAYCSYELHQIGAYVMVLFPTVLVMRSKVLLL